MSDELRALRPLWVPAGILVAAALLAWRGYLPPTLVGLRIWAPYAALGAAAALAFGYNRGRAFVIAVSILGAFAAWQVWHTRAVYTALAVLVAMNVVLVMLYRERGARYRASYAWLALLAAEGLLIAWIGRSPERSALDYWWLRSPPTPFIARLMLALAFAGAVWRAWPEYKPVPVGIAGAIATYFLAAEWAGSPGAYALFMEASGVMLIVALLQESHQLAFRDQLTGLPGRRALDERLRSVGGRYVVAMVDVDHFKQFNDTHGHDIGDQVLRLVAGRLAEVRDGIAYRYGGEEFCVLFPGGEIAEAERALEAIRRSIEHYRMAVRAPDRPKQAEEGAKRRGRIPSQGPPEKVLSVTVSIGLSAPAGGKNPREVLKAADEALYRAKKAGRNRVSR